MILSCYVLLAGVYTYGIGFGLGEAPPCTRFTSSTKDVMAFHQIHTEQNLWQHGPKVRNGLTYTTSTSKKNEVDSLRR
jgi:hypothetical protein